MKLKKQDLVFIDEAAQFFVNPGAVAKGLAWIGEPIERLQKKLPAKVQERISLTTRKAIEKALIAAVTTLPEEKPYVKNETESSNTSGWFHKASTSVTGALGGFFGFAALPIELPITTVIILRGILDQARVYGHDLNDLETRLECLMVFTMGSASPNDDASETGYFAARISVAQAVKAAASHLGGTSAKQLLGLLEKGATPAVTRLIGMAAQGFEVRVTQKLMGEMVPVLGALGGGAINFAFTEFYCRAAKYHFGLRSLEKKYGTEVVQKRLKESMGA